MKSYKTFVLLLMLLLTGLSCAGGKKADKIPDPLKMAADTVELKQLMKLSLKYLKEQQSILTGKYKFNSFDRRIEKNTMILTDKKNGQDKWLIHLVFAGTYSQLSGIWIWEWDNIDFNGQISQEILKVKDFGEKNAFKKLTIGRWKAFPRDTQQMTAISLYILKGKGVLRDSNNNIDRFLIFTDIEALK